MKHRNALIIFVKNPELGKVKSRLAETVGQQRALELYLEMLQETRDLAADVRADRFVFYDAFLPETDDLWSEEASFKKRLQLQVPDRGARMAATFEEVFKADYEKVVLIVGDCPDLDLSIIDEAYLRLDEVDVVIGPAKNGGYYLLGLKEPMEELFDNINWATSEAFDSTLTRMMEHELIWHELPILTIVDTEEDLKSIKARKLLKNIREKSLQLHEF